MRAPLLAPVLLIVLSIPLIFGWVPPNGLYGFRTPKTLSSRNIWYRANRMSGIYMVVAALVIAAGQLLLRTAGWPEERLRIAMLLIVLAPVAAALAASFAYLRKL
jgi:uncharacterized membrane protein